MFTQPSVNQIASAYQGNPAPLGQKVEADKKQHGGIPQDLRQLLALNDITQGRNAMGIQQALQIPTNMPTVAQDLQERARQALQARQIQAAQEVQRRNGQPNLVPPGTPQPPMQEQGLDALRTNVGEGYAYGGIIGNVQHFDDGGKTSTLGNIFRGIANPVANYFKEDLEKAEARRKLQEQISEAAPGLLEQLTDAERAERLKQVKGLSGQREQIESGERKTPYPQGGPAIPGTWDRPTGADDAAREVNAMIRKTPGVMDVMDAENKKASTAKVQGGQGGQGGGPRVNVPAQPGGIANLAPAMATPGGDYQRKILGQDEDALAAAKRAAYLKEVGSRDLSVYDQMAQELKARKERLNAPKAGYDAMMEYLGDIANSGGRTWMQAGSRGAASQQARNLDRLAQQDTLMEKILDLGAKKSEAQFNEKKGLFELTQGEKDRIIKDKTEAAKQLNLSEDKTRELIQNSLDKELDRKNRIVTAGMANHDNLMSRAQALMAADPTKKMTLEDAMKRAAMAAGATQMENVDVRKLGEYNKAKKEIEDRYMPVLLNRQTPEGAKMRAELAAKLAEARILHGLPPEQGINTLPGANPSGTVPAVGTVMEGYRFKGGNPKDQNNWEKV